MQQIFIPKYHVEECLKEIRECLEIGWTGLGGKTVIFENLFKEYTGFPYAHFTNSATAGLQLAVKILKEENNWKDNDEIVSTGLTFIATVSAISLEKMKVIFADVDESYCLDPKSVEEKITDKTKAVIYVMFGGNTGQYQEIVKICKKHNLKLILDLAHACGSRLNNKIPGEEADMRVFSFQAVKNLSLGEGGMICCKTEEQDKLARKISWCGISKNTQERITSKNVYKWDYSVEMLGYKFHGSAIAAAIGIAELPHLDQGNAYRRQITKWYNNYFKDNPKIKLQYISEECESSSHLYTIEVDNRDAVMLGLHEYDIFCGLHYKPSFEYKMYNYGKGTCPNTEKIALRIMSLPMHLKLTKKDVDYIADSLFKVMEKLTCE